MPTMHVFYPLAFAVLTGWAASAGAQVQRCTDARTGQVTYTDGSCASGQRGAEVLPALTPAEKAAQDAQYQAAQERWQAEHARTQALRQLEADKAAAQAAAAAAARPPVQIIQPPANSEESAESANAVLLPYPAYPDYYPPPHRPRPPHGKPPPSQDGPWQCNVFRCYDGKGNVRPRP